MMGPDSIRAEIRIAEEWQEYMTADLAELGFTGFERSGDNLVAYIFENLYLNDQREYLQNLEQNRYPAQLVSVTVVEQQDWNAIWESSISPIEVGCFFIRPSWSNAGKHDAVELIIDPKMAFGTGIHVTTRLMLRMLSGIDMTDKEVLDAGTGTGILAIAALKLGAATAFAFDVDPWSKENADENRQRNGCRDRLSVALGDSSIIPDGARYDVILANINRNALIAMIPKLVTHLRDGGLLCLSGLLTRDRDIIQQTADEASLRFSGLTEEAGWLALRFSLSGGDHAGG